MWIKKGGLSKTRIFSCLLTCLLISSTLFIGISLQFTNVEADQLDHTLGEVDFFYLTDFGRILQNINWQGKIQTVRDSMGFGYIGLVIDQDNYDHTPGAEIIADSFKAFPYHETDDFVAQTPIKFVIDDTIQQKSFGSFQNNGTTLDPFDIYVNQTAWTVANKDFAILQYSLTNIKSPAATLTNVCMGLEIPFSKDGGRFGVGGDLIDSLDDVDGYDAVNNVYWVEDTDSGTTVGIGSAIAADPINHYYGHDYNYDYNSQYKFIFQDESWLYNRLHAPNELATDGVTPANITTTVGWNGFTLGPGESRTFTYLIAINGSQSDMISAFTEGQTFYHDMATTFQITEISDSESGPAKIEVHNQGRPPTDVSTLSLSADVGALTGTWSVNPIPTYGYSVFTVNENIDFQGDTIILRENAVQVDLISFGTKGIAPDPLPGESTARYFEPSLMGYGNKWLRNASSGPTWGYQNNVPTVATAPSFLINEVMFNPTSIEGAFIELINAHPISSINIRNYQLVCNELLQIPDQDIWLAPGQKFLISYADAPTFFTNMIAAGDNVYMYNDNGVLYDMMGWSTPHIAGMSALRVPDGFGTNQGYDDGTSESAGWVFNTPNKVLLTEISDSGSTLSQIEIFNPKYPLIDFTTGFTLESSSAGLLAGLWSQPLAYSGEYGVFDVSTPSGLGADGDTITLYQNGYFIESIGYGTEGTVPDPLDDESVQRYWDGLLYFDVWERNWTTGPNFGLVNNVPQANLSTAIVLNEVVFYPSVPSNHFVELYHRFVLPVNISGFKIVGDSEYIVPQGTVLDKNQTFYYLQYVTDPGFFDPDLSHSADNIYLYDSNGSLMDMVGWSTPHTIDKSVSRVPDGNGTPDGYDDATSVLAEWQFDQQPTIKLLKVDVPQDNKSTKFGDFGEWVTFNLTIWNFQTISDLILISNSTLEGWLVEIFDETGTIKISDITLLADESKNIIIRVFIPSTFNFIVKDNITIDIVSTNNGQIWDSILLQAKLYPFVKVYKSASLIDINIEGTGYDEETTINLSALGTGAIMEGEISNAADIVFVVDDTGSMDPYLNSIKIEIQNIVQVFQDEIRDLRLGLVSYKDSPELDCNLTDNSTQFVDAVNMLIAAGGDDWEEDVLGAIGMAVGLGWRNGSVSKIIILIGDAPDHAPYDDVDQLVADAYRDEWGIYTNAIACGSDPITISTFTNIADNGSGIFYNYLGFMDPEALAQAIIDSVLTFVPKIDVAARDLDIIDSNPMIQDVLPPYIHYVPGSFSIPPDSISIDAFGNTILEWNVSTIKIGENWSVEFNVTSSLEGWQLANVVLDSRVSYTMWNMTNTTELFPTVLINVTSIPPPPKPPVAPDPPIPIISVIPGTDHTLLEWIPPPNLNIDHYLIYRAVGDPRAFDFSSPWVNTSLDMDPLGLDILGLRNSWNFTNDVTNSTEIYYNVRAVNNFSLISISSITVGKWTRTFEPGVSTFSIPIETFQTMTAEDYLNDMGAEYIKWMEPSTQEWKQHGNGSVNNITLNQGEGYQIKFASQTTYTFCGMPASMIRLANESYIGFDPTLESDIISASVNPMGNVTIVWTRPAGMDSDDNYKVYRAATRKGFHDGSAQLIMTIPYGTVFWIDSAIALPGTRYYYMVVPQNETGSNGTGTYSIGVWTQEYLAGYDTVGIPVKMDTAQTIDWLCDNISGSVGINYYIFTSQRWGWHSTIMPSGAFDTLMGMGEGYQISTSTVTRYSFIGF